MRWLEDRNRHRELIAEVKAGSEPARVPYPIRIREAEVLRTVMVGTGLIRVTLGGEGTTGFEAHAADEHVKLCFPEADGTLRLPEPDGLMLTWPHPSPTTRQYTVRRFDADTGDLDLDIAVHGRGLAADWAKAVQPGQTIHVAGPPGGAIVPHRYDDYLLAGDITALPAIARWLEELPRHAGGWAFIEVADAAEHIDLSPPAGVDVTWLHRGDAPPGSVELLAPAVTAVTVPKDRSVYVWAAGEAGSLKPIRRWVRDLGLSKTDYSITGYWKRGVADFDQDGHRH